MSEQIPHSGIHHDEYPIETFDNTPLPEAVERGLVNPTPDTPADLAPAPEKPKRNKLLIGGSIGLAGAVLAAGAIMGIKAADGSNNASPEKDPKQTTQTPEATPSPSATPEQQLTAQSIEIPASLTPEQIGVAVIQDRLSLWEMAGATDSNTTAWLHAPSADAFTLDLGQQNADKFAQALFIDGWQADASLTKFVTAEKMSNVGSVENFFKTNHITADQKATFPMDFEAYKRSVSVDPGDVTVLSQQTDTITLSILATEHDNADRNRLSSSLKGNKQDIEGNRFKATVTLKNVNGVEKIAAISIANP